ncbi:efflux RND transporter periplasmic adaptor subunit [uncultured Enterovirga sp.]|uniref:efflux RND transporter periplasmic adaptor subunit n=1 Tax=uncultured Enterovirga sp. TaxID=2026352 RepID=UPI0035CB6320
MNNHRPDAEPSQAAAETLPNNLRARSQQGKVGMQGPSSPAVDSSPRSDDPELRPRSRAFLWGKLGVAAIVVAALGFAVERHFAGEASKQAAAPPPAVPVVTTAVQQQDVPIIVTGLGTVQALNTAAIRSQVTGILEQVDFTEGQEVKKGDVLAQIDPRVFQAQLDQARAQLARDQALLTNQQTNLARNEPLLQRGFATDQQVTGQRAQVSQTESTLKADQAQIDSAQTQLDFASLKAPFDGVTGIRLLDVGNVIRPTDTNGLVVLTQMQPISVVFSLPASEIASVQAALARGTAPADVYDQAGTTKLDTGALLLINNQADPNSGTVQLKATFPNERRQLWPGTFVNAQLTTSLVKGALTVPTDAVQLNDKGQFVFVVGSDNKVSVRTVQVSQRLRAVALVAQGLKVGETVVVQGQYRLTPGTTVVASDPAQVPNTTTASAGMLP